ncbi:hypothetical protein DPMN_048887 [Dreissena polymorpha]|uniref:G-protein coupled receptors family 1 profile domain-containing protein n=1 Tax=Dreissena polymorpha TaxID=45954 RepID=A0A9D4DCC6_DREPO|nr:hypothetical protein DPMN_048887 [Dreissena polymorpha]
MEDPSIVTVMFMLSLFAVLGTIGNSLVLYIYSHKKEKSTAGIFIMSLAGTDLFTCLFIMPFTEAVVFLEYKLKYDVACRIYMFFITCNIPFAAFIMVAIAFDRYFCICHPFWHVLNIVRAKVIVVCLLILASAFGLITAIAHGTYSYGVFNSTVIQKVNIPQLNNNLNVSFTQMPIDNHSANETLYVSYLNNVYANNASLIDLEQDNAHRNYTIIQREDIIHNGICMPNDILIGPGFLSTYQRVYAGTYLLSFIVVFVLYGLIYRSIHKHRAKRSKRKRSSLYPLTGIEFSNVETQFTAVTHVNPHNKHRSSNSLENGEAVDGDGECLPELQPMRQIAKSNPRAMFIKEKTLMANIRTAIMLFVVTIVFLIAFLPAWLMGLAILDYNQVIFYMYFIYHTTNPFIYAFMNKSFRDDLGKVIKCQSMPIVR